MLSAIDCTARYLAVVRDSFAIPLYVLCYYYYYILVAEVVARCYLVYLLCWLLLAGSFCCCFVVAAGLVAAAAASLLAKTGCYYCFGFGHLGFMLVLLSLNCLVCLAS